MNKIKSLPSRSVSIGGGFRTINPWKISVPSAEKKARKRLQLETVSEGTGNTEPWLSTVTALVEEIFELRSEQ